MYIRCKGVIFCPKGSDCRFNVHCIIKNLAVFFQRTITILLLYPLFRPLLLTSKLLEQYRSSIKFCYKDTSFENTFLLLWGDPALSSHVFVFRATSLEEEISWSISSKIVIIVFGSQWLPFCFHPRLNASSQFHFHKRCVGRILCPFPTLRICWCNEACRKRSHRTPTSVVWHIEGWKNR